MGGCQRNKWADQSEYALQNVERTLEINIEAFDEERSALLETIEWQENEIARLRILLGYDVTSDEQSGPGTDPF